MQTYNRLATQFYDLAKTEEDAQPEIAFYSAYADDANGPILEPMCGSGRLLLPLLRIGYDIEGFDASAFMLDALRERFSENSPEDLPVWQQNVQDFKRDKHYSLIMIPFGSWGLILDEQERQCSLQALYDHLLPGGTLVMEIDTVASESGAEPVWREQSFDSGPGTVIAVHMKSVYNPQTHIYNAVSVYTLSEYGVVVETEHELFDQYVFGHDELDVQLQAVGFTTIKKYKNYDKELAVDENEPTIIYECWRPISKSDDC